MNDWMGVLASGFAGAILAQVLAIVWNAIVRRREFRSLMSGVVAECEYNLSVLDEIVSGVMRNGSFKRLSVEFLKYVRESAVRHKLRRDFMIQLSRVCVDLELLNRETDYVFNGLAEARRYAGAFGKTFIDVTSKPMSANIGNTIRAAREGVFGSLTKLKELALEECGMEVEDED